MGRIVVLDIETIPCDESLRHLIPEPQPPAAIKKEESLARWREETLPGLVEEAYLKTALTGELGRICCICLSVDGALTPTEKAMVWTPEDSSDPAGSFMAFGGEADLLMAFWSAVNSSDLLVGHNILGFDLPFIWQRSVINRVQPSFPLRLAKYREEPVYDTMQVWCNWGYGKYTKLDFLAEIMGLDVRKAGEGSEVWEMWRDGRYKELADYCMQDVRITREVFRRMKFLD